MRAREAPVAMSAGVERWIFAPGSPKRLAAVRIGLCLLLAARLSRPLYVQVAGQPAALFRPISFMHLFHQMPSASVALSVQVITVLAALLPAVFVGRWTSRIPSAPSRLASLPRETTLAVVAASPRRSDQYTDLAVPMVWQAEAHFSFRLANAYVGSFPPELPLAVRRFEFHRSSERSAVRDWMRRSGVDAVLVVRRSAATLRQDVP